MLAILLNLIEKLSQYLFDNDVIKLPMRHLSAPVVFLHSAQTKGHL